MAKVIKASKHYNSFLKGNILDLKGSVKHKGGPIDFRKLRADMESEIAKSVVSRKNNP